MPGTGFGILCALLHVSLITILEDRCYYPILEEQAKRKDTLKLGCSVANVCYSL